MTFTKDVNISAVSIAVMPNSTLIYTPVEYSEFVVGTNRFPQAASRLKWALSQSSIEQIYKHSQL